MVGWMIDGAKLRALREESGTRPEEFATRVGCHVQHLRKIELYKQQPGGILARACARELTHLLGRRVLLADFGTPAQEEAA